MAARADDVDVVLRRSSRKRAERGWNDSLQLTIRASRSSGTSLTVPVTNRGGQPSHKKRKKPKSISAQARLPFCGRCGYKHANTTVNFCCRCGLKREVEVSAEANQVIVHQASAEANQVSVVEPNQVVVEASAEASRSAGISTKNADTKKRKLRCGWHVCGQIFIDPDGVEFASREDAKQSKHRLEPSRQDGWQVFVDETETHTTWIAPDGEKLHSFKSAKAYSQSTALPLYGKDGRTKNIQSFFGAQKKKVEEPISGTVVDLTKPAPESKAMHTPQPHKKTPQPRPRQEEQQPRQFKLPPQTIEGAELQKILRRCAVLRNQRKSVSALQLADRYTIGYTVPRKISRSMTNKVCVVCHVC